MFCILALPGFTMNDEEKRQQARAENEQFRKLTNAADQLDIRLDDVIVDLHNSISNLLDIERSKPETERSRITGKRIVNKFLRTTYWRHGENTPEILRGHHIHSGTDVGRMVFVLCEHEVGYIREEQDTLADFDGLFTTDALWDYMQREQLYPKKKTDHYRAAAYTCYAIGISLFIASYYGLVSKVFIWPGSAIGLAGWLLIAYRKQVESFMARRKAAPVKHP